MSTEDPTKVVRINDMPPVNHHNIDEVELELDSPRLLQACKNLGVLPEEIDPMQITSKGSQVSQIYTQAVGKKKIDQEIQDKLAKHIRTRLIELINKVLEERNKIKFADFLQYLKANPKKSRRRYGFVKAKNAAGFRMSVCDRSTKSSQNLIQDIAHTRRGSATFIKTARVLGTPKTSKSARIRSDVRGTLKKPSPQKARLLRSQRLIKEDQEGLKKIQKIASTFKAVDLKMKNKNKKVIESIAKENEKREQRLLNYKRIQQEIEHKRKENEEVHEERMRAYEILKKKIDIDIKENLEKQRQRYMAKKEKVMNKRKEMANKETEFRDKALKFFDVKFGISGVRRGINKESVKERARSENKRAIEHYDKFKTQSYITNEKNYFNSIEAQIKVNKKIDKIRKNKKLQSERMKQQTSKRTSKIDNNKKQEEYTRSIKVDRLLKKMKRNEQNVQTQRHLLSQEIELKQQKRKWKEKDIEITMQRQKRILQTKQDALIQKEQKYSQRVQLEAEKARLALEKNYRENVKELKERDKLMETLTNLQHLPPSQMPVLPD
ncbi:unnamed protein product [Moneuplotes crassus]|uniref:Uncharacterized protein n=1 Tax=Euplotes crassus TaxID=5936 RepID=A0AAD1X742_EUPCR|nr:unnamed protein product [Moneuplotes crassus]